MISFVRSRNRIRIPERPALLLLAVLPILALLSVSSAHGRESDPPGMPDPAVLELASVNVLIVDLESDEVLYGRNAERAVPVASITKLMTALVVLESGLDLDEPLPIVARAEPPPANAWSRIRIDSRLARGDLLNLALIASENLAAYNLARHHPGGFDAFVADMNERARELGMTDTRFVDPSGLSDENRSSAADLARLLKATAQYEEIRAFSTVPRFMARFSHPRYGLRYTNTNALVHNPRWDIAVSKTGYLDAAGRCLAMVARIDGRELAMIFLDAFGTRSPVGDAARVRRWLETGNGGTVAGPAAEYRDRRMSELGRIQGSL